MGKGDKPRPVNKLIFNRNYNIINWRKEPKLTPEQMKELIKEVKKTIPTSSAG